MDSTSFLDMEGHVIKTSPMEDEHQIIRITEKTPEPKDIGKIVCGDTNSDILTFEMNRYYDNVDLLTKNIKFIVRNGLGMFTEDAVNLRYNGTLIRFSWVLSDAVTYRGGEVTAAIAFIGDDGGKKYALKTVPFTIKVEGTLDFTEYEPEYKNWFTDVEARLWGLERNGTVMETDPIDFEAEFSQLLGAAP